ncbi:MAG TPA: sigma-70 family RNA polymerase sigma factor [Candidatus Binatia bacterium]|nr:sigma-70 family RNA polymerase sigma factor [Candidatus Binatia bacterium]
MPLPEDNPTPETAGGAQFAATSWTNVLAAQQGGSPEAAAALEKLCRTYWFPLYAYTRRKGYDPHKAQDLTQEFFYRLLKENYLGAVDRRRGKFRSFLLAALNHFLSNQRDHDRAAKRGGRYTFISLDDTDAENRFKLEPASDLSPEKIFERNWFLTLFDHALTRLREEQAAAGRAELFDQLKQFLIEDAESGDYDDAGARVNMRPNAVAVTVHRWRERYKKLVHEEILRTVADPAEIEEELRRFFITLEQ